MQTLPDRIASSQMTLKLPKGSIVFEIQIKGDMVCLNPSLIRDYQQTKSVVTNMLLKLEDIVFLEMTWDIHAMKFLGRGAGVSPSQ